MKKPWHYFVLLSIFLVWIVKCEIIPETDVERVKELKKMRETAYISDNKELKNGCSPSLPNLSVGDIFITSNGTSLDELKRSHKVFLLAISDSACDTCCRGEPLLDELHQMFRAGDLAFKGQPIPIVRADINESKDLAEREQLSIKSVPRLVLRNHDGKYYAYDENFNVEFVLHFINRHLYPVVLLKNEEEIDSFIDVYKEWTENTPFYVTKYFGLRDIFPKMKKITRVVAFATDKSELEDLKDVATQLATRDDLRIGKVTNKNLVKKYKEKLGHKAFGEYSTNSLVLFKKMPEDSMSVSYFDLSSDTRSYYNWINDESLDTINELSGGSYKIADLINKPMFMTFISNQSPKYFETLDILKAVALKHPQYLFMYAGEKGNEEKKKYLGITWKEEPSMALNYRQGAGSIIFPRKNKFSIQNVNEFLRAYENGELDQNFIGLKDAKNSYKSNMPTVAHLDKETYPDFCLKEGTDVLLLLYDSSSNEEENDMASKFFEKAAKRFSDLKLPSLKLAAYDTYTYGMPGEMEYTKDLPQLIFLPAFHKDPPYRYFQDIRTKNLMENVQKAADVQFSLPEYAHLSTKELIRFHNGVPLEDL